MNERSERRVELGLSQSDAARKAGLSLATWRRWEEKPDSVSAKTRAAAEKVVAAAGGPPLDGATVAIWEEAWGASPVLTPRQGYAIAATIGMWADLHLGSWLNDPHEPLHSVPPFDDFDLRVMMHVNESRAWVEAVRERCDVICDELEKGILPFDRSGPYIDEVLIGAALDGASDWMTDLPETFEGIEAGEGADLDVELNEDESDFRIRDDEWDRVRDTFDDMARWGDWEVPILRGHPLLPHILSERHPFTWFDRAPGERSDD